VLYASFNELYDSQFVVTHLLMLFVTFVSSLFCFVKGEDLSFVVFLILCISVSTCVMTVAMEGYLCDMGRNCGILKNLLKQRFAKRKNVRGTLKLKVLRSWGHLEMKFASNFFKVTRIFLLMFVLNSCNFLVTLLTL